MKTLVDYSKLQHELYTNVEIVTKKGLTFNVYKDINNVNEIVFTIRDFEKKELCFRKTKRAVFNYLLNY